MNRRRFLGYLSIPALLSLTGGAVGQIVRQADYAAIPVWYGSLAARPDPADAGLNHGTVLYIASESGAMYTLDAVDDTWSILPGSRPLLVDALTEDQTVSNTTTETTVFNPSLPADELLKNDVYQLPALGTYTTTNSTEQFTLRFHIGSTEVASVTSVAANVSQAPWYATLYFTVRAAGASGTVKPHVVSVFDNVHDDQHAGPVSLDTTAASTFSVTVQWDEANVSNEVLVGQAYLKRVGTVV